MVKLPLYHDHDKNESETAILHKVNLGYPFKDEKNIFKNIHSFLKSKNRVSPLNASNIDKKTDSSSPERLQPAYKVADHSALTLRSEKTSSLCDHSKNDTATKRDTFCLNIGEPTIRKNDSNIFNSSQEPRHSFSNDLTPYCSLNNEVVSPLATRNDTHDGILLPPPQYNQPRLIRRNNSLSSNNSTRQYRHNNFSSIKRSRKSLKGGRESLKRYNSTDTYHIMNSGCNLISTQSISCKTQKSKLVESNIPFYHDESITSDQFPRITAETLKKIVKEEIYRNHYDACFVVDCRFEYEFKGGHITNAINISSREELEQLFIQCQENVSSLLIFHCEFSTYRGPMLASHLRNCDRMINYDNYPDLYYPDILILDGGYKVFFDNYPELCYPRKYVGMDSSENLVARDQEMERFRHDSKKMVSRNSSLQKLTSVSSSTRSSFKKTGSSQDLITGMHKLKPVESPNFRYEAPPKLSMRKYSQSNVFMSSDECSSTSRLSITSSPNLNSNKICLTDDFDNDSFYSFDEGDTTFTTPVETLNTPNAKKIGNRGNESSPLNPVKRLLFSDILMEEEGDVSE